MTVACVSILHSTYRWTSIMRDFETSLSTYRTKPLSLKSRIFCTASHTFLGGIMHTADLWSLLCADPDMFLACLAGC